MDTLPHQDLAPLNDPSATGHFLGLPVQTLAQWRHQGTGIPFVRVGRLIRYRREDILRFVSENLQEVT